MGIGGGAKRKDICSTNYCRDLTLRVVAGGLFNGLSDILPQFSLS